EFVHQSQGCLINHREVGTHTRSFAAALRGALREDPDIILVGEMRDLETIRLALEAANTGHLVLGTLHTTNAAKTIDRIIEVFPAAEQAQVRNGLSTGLKLVVAQNLFRRIDKRGRCAALEILVCTAAVGNLIREGKTVQIPSAIQTGKQFGMQTLDDAIMAVLQKGWISAEEAYDKGIDKAKFRALLKNPPDEVNQPQGAAMRKSEIDDVLGLMLESYDNVSDLNVTCERPLQVEAAGELVPVPVDPAIDTLTPFQTEIFALNLINNDRRLTEHLIRQGSCDSSYSLPGKARFRVNIL